jgi:hypothetical protein
VAVGDDASCWIVGVTTSPTAARRGRWGPAPGSPKPGRLGAPRACCVDTLKIQVTRCRWVNNDKRPLFNIISVFFYLTLASSKLSGGTAVLKQLQILIRYHRAKNIFSL